MDVHGSFGGRARVVIAGGGFAALEAALAMRALAGERIELTLVSPEPVLHYRPAATTEAFSKTPARRYDLRMIAADLRAVYRRASLESVASQERSVHISSGARLHYDALILATGARATVAIPGALTFRDQRDLAALRQLVAELETGAVRRIAFVVPTGCSWPLPLYEFALLSATRAEQRGVDAEITLVTPEPEPLALFGRQASGLVRDLLSERGVRFIGATAGFRVLRAGLLITFSGSIAAERFVAAPQLQSTRIAGVPGSWWGFVPTDICGRVEGLADVYAAGDITTFPIKQGGLAAQQADRIAHTIASGLGAPVKELRADHLLRARLLGGDRTLALRTELDAFGEPTSAALEYVDKNLPGGSPKVFGRYLTPYLARLETRRRDAA
ncbi:MAG: NAD(P)/FAD-dependent oxidoreductase [Solirubrobacteraceae bacterium]